MNVTIIRGLAEFLLKFVGGLFILDSALCLYLYLLPKIYFMLVSHVSEGSVPYTTTAIFLLPTIGLAAAYCYFGYCLLQERAWTLGMAGSLVAVSLVILPSFATQCFSVGGTFFLAFSVVGILLGYSFNSPRERANEMKRIETASESCFLHREYDVDCATRTNPRTAAGVRKRAGLTSLCVASVAYHLRELLASGEKAGNTPDGRPSALPGM